MTDITKLKDLLSESRKFIDFCRFQALAPSNDDKRPNVNYREDCEQAHSLAQRIEEALK